MLKWMRLLPIALVVAAAIVFVFQVEGRGAYAWRNAVPMLAVLTLAALCLQRGDGRYTGAGWQWPLGTAGFAIPAMGLSLYLHYAYATDLYGMVSDSLYPAELFRYLPIYTLVAGAIGFAIGWIAGRDV